MGEFDDEERNKTVLRQVPPADGMDRTVLRPTPGRRGASTGVPTGMHVPQIPNDRHKQPSPFTAGAAMAQIQIYRGLNPLVSAASILIALMVNLRNTFSHDDVNGVYQRLCNEINTFEAQAKSMGERPEIVLAARYVLCASLDEAVLTTPWGTESAWRQKTLLVAFHNEMGGGEKFFNILDRIRQTPAENLHMLELMYLCISLGFKGKYQLTPDGRDKLEQIRDEVFHVIRNYRGEYERDLSPSWRSNIHNRSTLTRYVPFWVAASATAALLLLIYFGFRVWMDNTAAYVEKQLVEIEQAADQELAAVRAKRERLITK